MGAAAWICSGSMSAARAERDAEGLGCRALRFAQQAQAGVFRQSEAGEGLAYDAAVTGHADMGFLAVGQVGRERAVKTRLVVQGLSRFGFDCLTIWC